MDFSSLAVLSGIPAQDPYNAVGLPIYATVAYGFSGLEDGAYKFATNQGYTYTRLQNPTVAALEARLTALEGALGAVCLASGQAASFASLLALVRAGEEVVASPGLFGGTVGLLGQVFGLMGVRVHFVEPEVAAVRAVLNEKTRAVFVEVLGNPSLKLPDLQGLARLCEEHQVALVVDNTFGAVGALARPLEHGTHVVVHSLTKWASGHGSVLGGAVLSRETALWQRYPQFSSPDAQGKIPLGAVRPAMFSGAGAPAGAIALRDGAVALQCLPALSGLRDPNAAGGASQPDALTLARWLQAQPQVAWVRYPGLPGDPAHPRAAQYLRGGFGSILTFGLRGGPRGASRFLAHLNILQAPNVGDARTLAVHPWTTNPQPYSGRSSLGGGGGAGDDSAFGGVGKPPGPPADAGRGPPGSGGGWGMKISTLLQSGRPLFSFEFFPPKTPRARLRCFAPCTS